MRVFFRSKPILDMGTDTSSRAGEEGHGLEANVKVSPYPTICMGELGCFPTTPDFVHHFFRPINRTPWPRDKVRTKLLLFTKASKNDAYQLFAWNQKNFDLSPLDRTIPVKVIVPGWLDSRVTASWFRRMKDTFVDYGNYNVIVVEWDNLIPYLQATSNTRVVGAELASLITFMVQSGGFEAEQFHLIGHSLGAHICGYAGKRVPKLGRITGLDAARAFFQGMPPTVRLDKTDANFVDVIHSDTNPILPIGFRDAIGHVDFYPNGASPQPGCFLRDRLFRGLEDGLIDGHISTVFLQMIRYNTLCSHQLSHKWFERSIINSHNGGCQLVGVRCSNYKEFVNGDCSCDDSPDSCSIMGLDAEQLFHSRLSGLSSGHSWFLRASGRDPFCQFQYQMVMQLEENGGGFDGKGTVRITLNYFSEGKEALQVSVEPPLSKLFPNLRLPYLMTSNEPLGEIYSIYISWTPEEDGIEDRDDVGQSVYGSNQVLFDNGEKVIHLKHIRVSPIQANYGRVGGTLTRHYCKARSNEIRALETVLLEHCQHF